MFQVCFKYFRCFRLILQVFHLNVAKVDLDFAYMLLWLYIHVSSVYFKYFI
jgi:hypothetical protein